MNKTRKINWLPLTAFTAVMVMAAVGFAGCGEDEPGNQAPTPVVSAGVSGNAEIELANDMTIALTGSVSISSGSISSFAWSLKTLNSTAPASQPTFTNDGYNTTVSGISKAGTYVFELSATSAKNVSGANTVTVVVKPMTKQIIVPALDVNPGPSINFSQTITGWDTNFPSAAVYYILTLGDTPFPEGTTSLSTTGLQDDSFHTITQTFYYKEVPIQGGSRSIEVEVSGNAFTDVYGSFSELTLTLSKSELTPWETATVEFVVLGSGESIDFSPSTALPAGVTYTVTDGKGSSWGGTTAATFNNFNGQVSATHYSDGDVTFTQTFYLNGTKISGGERIVKVSVATLFGADFTSIISDTGSVTLVHP